MKCYVKDYPRPQFVRKNWENLNGIWDFSFDDSNVGEQEKWYHDFKAERNICVPFTYETAASGITASPDLISKQMKERIYETLRKSSANQRK